MTEIEVRMEVGTPTDDTLELEGEEPTEVRLWPLLFFKSDSKDPILGVEIALEKEQDEEGLYPAFTVSALEDRFEPVLASVMTLGELDMAGDETPDWIDEDDLKRVQELSDDEQEIYGQVSDLLDFAQGALEEESIEAGTVVRHSELMEEMDEDDEEEE